MVTFKGTFTEAMENLSTMQFSKIAKPNRVYVPGDMIHTIS